MIFQQSICKELKPAKRAAATNIKAAVITYVYIFLIKFEF